MRREKRFFFRSCRNYERARTDSQYQERGKKYVGSFCAQDEFYFLRIYSQKTTIVYEALCIQPSAQIDRV